MSSMAGSFDSVGELAISGRIEVEGNSMKKRLSLGICWIIGRPEGVSGLKGLYMQVRRVV